VQFEQEFVLRDGEAAQVDPEGLMLRFERVSRDTRCPVGDPCRSEGDAVVRVSVWPSPNAPVVLDLHTDPSLTTEGRYLQYLVRLVRLQPRPVGEQHVPLPRYWATFVVSKK